MAHLANLKRARLSDDTTSGSSGSSGRHTSVPPSPRQQRSAINSEVLRGCWVGRGGPVAAGGMGGTWREGPFARRHQLATPPYLPQKSERREDNHKNTRFSSLGVRLYVDPHTPGGVDC